MGWVTKDAPTPSELDSCVQCGLCLPHCPTFRLTGRETESPRGRLAAMSAVASGEVAIDATFEEIMSSCLQCRACEPVCPSLVPFGRAMEGARIELSAQRPTAARRFRHMALARAVRRPILLALAGRAARLATSEPLRHLTSAAVSATARGIRRGSGQGTVKGESYRAVGKRIGRVGLLSGCVMDSWFSDVHIATIEVLRLAGYDVAVPARQTCCGALAAHDGDAGAARRLAVENVTAFAHYDLVVANSAGCGAHLKEYGTWVGSAGEGLARRVRDVTEVVSEALHGGRLPRFTENRGPVAVQDPCHLRNAQGIVIEPRAVVQAAGYTPIDVDPTGTCCGAAGIYSLLYPQRSAQLGARKREEIEASGSTIVSSANPGCEMQLRAHLERYYRVVHPVELYWESHREASRLDETLSR